MAAEKTGRNGVLDQLEASAHQRRPISGDQLATRLRRRLLALTQTRSELNLLFTRTQASV